MKLKDDGGSVTISFAYSNDDIILEVSFQQFLFRGYVELDDAEQIRSELTKAINKARSSK